MLKRLLKKASFWLFEAGQIFNVFIVPVHYYVSLSSTRQLRKSRERWNRPVDLSPLPLSPESQKQILTEWIAPFESEYRGNKVYLDGIKKRAGPGFGYIEAQALHGFIRKTRPRRVIEVGSGVSTWCMLAALQATEKEGHGPFQMTCIQPYPSEFLRSFPVRLNPNMVEEVDLSLFDELEAGDLLFIDSGHAVRPCADVSRIYFEILPRLKPGVFIHIHDVSFPYMFQRSVEWSHMQWMETGVLFALLAHSTRFEILLCLSLLHYNEPELLKKVFPEYDPQPNAGGLPGSGVKVKYGASDERHFPSSIYIVIK